MESKCMTSREEDLLKENEEMRRLINRLYQSLSLKYKNSNLTIGAMKMEIGIQFSKYLDPEKDD